MNSSLQILLLFSILCISCCTKVHSSAPLSMLDRYQQWMAKHNKMYTNSFDAHKRFQIFQKNAKYIDAHNAKVNKTYTLGLNQFADMTNEERVARFTGYKPHRVWNASRSHARLTASYEELPTNWDWRQKGACTPIKDQTCGNCWLFSGVAAVESMNFIKTGKLNILSEQEIMDCDDLPGKGGCNGGWSQEVYEYIKHYSLTLEADYPNKPEAQTCDKSKKSKHRYARVSSFVNMQSSLSDEELMAAVVKQPLAIVIDASSPAFGAYKSGVFNGQCGIQLNHGVNLVGFGETEDGQKYWIVRNSWGAGWGDNGYIKIARGTGGKEGLCGVKLWPSYPVY